MYLHGGATSTTTAGAACTYSKLLAHARPRSRRRLKQHLRFVSTPPFRPARTNGLAEEGVHS